MKTNDDETHHLEFKDDNCAGVYSLKESKKRRACVYIREHILHIQANPTRILFGFHSICVVHAAFRIECIAECFHMTYSKQHHSPMHYIQTNSMLCRVFVNIYTYVCA